MTTATNNGKLTEQGQKVPTKVCTQEIIVIGTTIVSLDNVPIMHVADDPTVEEPFTIGCYHPSSRLTKRQMAAICATFIDVMRDELVQNADNTPPDLLQAQIDAVRNMMHQLKDYARYGTVIPW